MSDGGVKREEMAPTILETFICHFQQQPLLGIHRLFQLVGFLQDITTDLPPPHRRSY